MKVAIRADASKSIGSGHVMRSLALAEALTAFGHEVFFICASLDGNLSFEIEVRGFVAHSFALSPVSICNGQWNWELDSACTRECILNKGGVDWIVVDHYQLDARWHHAVFDGGTKILVIDDLANRPLDCDLLVDQNMLSNVHSRYDQLVPKDCHKLLGPAYTLLRAEFGKAYSSRQTENNLTMTPRDLLVFMGGSDQENLTFRIMKSLKQIQRDNPVTVLAGEMNPWRETLHKECLLHNWKFHVAHKNVAELLIGTRAAIIATGMFSLELQALQVPCLLVPLSDIQRQVAEKYAKIGRAFVFEKPGLEDPRCLGQAIDNLMCKPFLPDGKSPIALDGARRIAEHMSSYP